MPADAKAYLQELAQTAGLDAELQAHLLKALDNPRFSKGLGEGVARQSEFSRAMDELRTQQDAAAKIQKDNAEWFATHKPIVDAANRDLAAYRTRFGDLDPNNPGARPAAGLSKEEIEKQLKEISERSMAFTASVSKQVAFVTDDYRSRFNKPLDLEALEKLALEKNLTVRQAYAEMIEPEVKAKADTDQKALLDKTAKDAVTEYASKHNLPVDEGAGEPAPFFQRPAEGAKPLTDTERARSFANEWTQHVGATP